MFIKKFKINSALSEENEFEVTRTRITTTSVGIKSITDDEGNVLSPSNVLPPDIKQTIREEITAISLPSKTPANVVVLEVVDEKIEETNQDPQSVKSGPKIMEGPVRKRPITLDQLNGDRVGNKPIVITSDPEKAMWV